MYQTSNLQRDTIRTASSTLKIVHRKKLARWDSSSYNEDGKIVLFPGVQLCETKNGYIIKEVANSFDTEYDTVNIYDEELSLMANEFNQLNTKLDSCLFLIGKNHTDLTERIHGIELANTTISADIKVLLNEKNDKKNMRHDIIVGLVIGIVVLVLTNISNIYEWFKGFFN